MNIYIYKSLIQRKINALLNNAIYTFRRTHYDQIGKETKNKLYEYLFDILTNIQHIDEYNKIILELSIDHQYVDMLLHVGDIIIKMDQINIYKRIYEFIKIFNIYKCVSFTRIDTSYIYRLPEIIDYQK